MKGKEERGGRLMGRQQKRLKQRHAKEDAVVGGPEAEENHMLDESAE